MSYFMFYVQSDKTKTFWLWLFIYMFDCGYVITSSNSISLRELSSFFSLTNANALLLFPLCQARYFINSTMIGIGITPEGIHQNEVVYEFFLENTWRTSPRDIHNWTETFVSQRYGLPSPPALSAWHRLMVNEFGETNFVEK